MMSRRELREHIFKLLFRVEFNPAEDMPEQIQLFFEDEDVMVDEQDRAEIDAKYEAILAKVPELDQMLDEKTEKWDVSRMGKVDLTILRVALYEMLYDESVPAPVAINEAVEIAKKYGQDESPSFINGVLAKFAK